jgi:hypothetical protein
MLQRRFAGSSQDIEFLLDLSRKERRSVFANAEAHLASRLRNVRHDLPFP